MAGDWIKFEKATSDKPEVWTIAEALGLDPDAVVGKMLRVWAWFDDHTENGNAPSVTKSLLDRLVGVTGFCDCVVAAGWMKDKNGKLTLPNFDHHNGETAKKRALTAKRAAKCRQKSNAKSNADSVTGSVTSALPREEKRREEKKESRRRAHALPDDFEPNERNHQLSGELSVSLTDELGRFTDYHKAKGSKFKDWNAALNNWLRNTAKFEKEKAGQTAPKLKEYKG